MDWDTLKLLGSFDMKVVISQPMYIPWPGLFDQVKNADIFVHYDDVALPQGRSFISRVQLNINCCLKWLTVPIKGSTRRKLICDVEIDNSQEWFKKHTSQMTLNFSKSPYFSDVKSIIDDISKQKFQMLSALNIYSIEMMAKYMGLHTKFIRSSSIDAQGRSTERLVDICRHLNAKEYITGHGAKKYMDHEIFEANGIQVKYMHYIIKPCHENFTPFCTTLDLISHVGKFAKSHLNSETVNWRDFIYE